jgi:hypothetical protein
MMSGSKHDTSLSSYLVMYNDFIGNFGDNRLWNELVDEKA